MSTHYPYAFHILGPRNTHLPCVLPLLVTQLCISCLACMHRHACCNTLLFVCAQLSIDYVLHHVFCLLLNTGSYKPSQASKVVRPVYICLASCCTCMQTSFLVCFAHIWPAQDDPPSPAQFPTCNRYQVCVPYVGIYVSISHYKMKRVVQNL